MLKFIRDVLYIVAICLASVWVGQLVLQKWNGVKYADPEVRIVKNMEGKYSYQWKSRLFICAAWDTSRDNFESESEARQACEDFLKICRRMHERETKVWIPVDSK